MFLIVALRCDSSMNRPPPSFLQTLQLRAYQRHRAVLSSHPNIHVLRLDAQNYESTMKKLFSKLPLVEDLLKAFAFVKTTRTDWIHRTPDGKSIAKQYQTEMKPLEAEARALLDEIKKQERESHAASGGGGGSAPTSSVGHTPPPTPPALSSSAPLPSTPLSAAAASESSSLPLLLEVTDSIAEVKDDLGTYLWPVVVRTGVLFPAANVRVKSMRGVLFIGCLKGLSITILTPEGGSAKADRAIPGAFAVVSGCARTAVTRDIVSQTTRGARVTYVMCGCLCLTRTYRRPLPAQSEIWRLSRFDV